VITKEKNAETAASAEKMCFLCALCVLVVVSPSVAVAQTRLAVLQAEDRRAPTAADLVTIRGGARSSDPQLARIGVRALGRLERPSLISDILPALRHSVPEVRAEAANAIGQASQGWKREKPDAGLDAALAALAARLKVDAEPDVRAAIAETIGRLPYASGAQVEKAEQVLVDFDGRAESVTDRLGVAKGFEALVRISRKLHEPGPDALAVLKRDVVAGGAEATTGARIRRLSLEALIPLNALDEGVIAAAVADKDAQVRRLAMRAAPVPSLLAAVNDDSPIVRIEALRQLKARFAEQACAPSLEAAADREPHVALVAIDQLGSCGAMPDAVAALDRAVTDLSDAGAPRRWHRAAHALVALAEASPDRGAAVLGQFTGSKVWQLRMYAARAAASLQKREALEALANDADDNVREAAVDGLRTKFGHDADALFVAQLTRPGNQILRAAALALVDSPNSEAAMPALRTAQDRLNAEGRDNSHDARDAIAKALASFGVKEPGAGKKNGKPARPPALSNDLNADDLRRLAAPRARITMRDIGTFELALFTVQAPATVLRFARLAESGYYNGLTFHRVVPNFVIQGGSPGANEYVGDAAFMRDELGLWPHVRGAVGISTRGRDTGDAQIFIDLVDNPRLDHEYTVFGQVLNGIDVVDRILEGDVIERIEIISGP
jgi:cyclophilin family peptidyl-prolyl cis-trans isomerase/HEAT repeat protein